MGDKKATLFYHSWLGSLRLLPKDKACDLMFALLEYGETGERAQFDDLTLTILFNEYSQAIDRDKDSYAKRCETNRNNAMSGRAKRTLTIASDGKQSDAKRADNDNDNDNDNDIYISIVNRLNEKCGTRYKASSAKTRSLIRARLNEGFKEEDFYTVIDKKSAEWLSDSKMSKYLRPETLFGTKFEAYLNQQIQNNAQIRPNNRFVDFEQRDNRELIEIIEKGIIGG